jgi:hypothetical protein
MAFETLLRRLAPHGAPVQKLISRLGRERNFLAKFVDGRPAYNDSMAIARLVGLMTIRPRAIAKKG